jgi:hypothetical protein
MPSRVCARREFRLADDMYAQDSIELLKQSGINFAQNEARGIEVQRFGEVLMSSGIVLNDEARGPPSGCRVSFDRVPRKTHTDAVCARLRIVLQRAGAGAVSSGVRALGALRLRSTGRAPCGAGWGTGQGRRPLLGPGSARVRMRRPPGGARSAEPGRARRGGRRRAGRGRRGAARRWARRCSGSRSTAATTLGTCSRC